MGRNRRNTAKAHHHLFLIVELYRKTKIKLTLLPLSILLSFGAALFNGISVALLIPTIKGIVNRDFTFVNKIPVLKDISVSFFEISPNSFSSIFVLLILLILSATAVKCTFTYYATTTFSYLITRFSNSLRKIIFSAYMTYGKSYFDQASIGSLSHTLLTFSGTVARSLSGWRTAFISALSIGAYLVVMAIISWKLTLLAIIIFPFTNIAMTRLIREIKKISLSYTNISQSFSRNIFNSLLRIPLIKTYYTKQSEQRQFADENDLLSRLEFSMDKKRFLLAPIHEMMISASIVFVFSITAFLVFKQGLDISSLLVFFYLAKKTAYNITSFNNIRVHTAEMTGPIIEILETLNCKEKYIIPDGPIEFPGIKEGIKVDHLNFSYPNRAGVLNDITLRIEKGKITALVGPTGSGKTTFINLIVRFYDCPPSSIKIDDIDIRDFSLKSLMSKIALVNQDPILFHSTLRENIVYGLDRRISDKELNDIIDKVRLFDLVSKLPNGLDTYIGDRGVQLSGGEKQRVAIARALLKDTDILILDEATSSLDSKSERLVQNAINEVVKGRTTIVIAHRFSTIKNADKILVIENGSLIEQGSFYELLEKRGKFYKYCQTQMFIPETAPFSYAENNAVGISV